MVEILFARGLVRMLFATETFAMVRQINSRGPRYYSLDPHYPRLGSKHAGSMCRVFWHPET